VLAGEEAREVRARLQLVGRDRCPLELVEAVEPPDDVCRGGGRAHPFTSGADAV
jgi:hypothetical protein